MLDAVRPFELVPNPFCCIRSSRAVHRHRHLHAVRMNTSSDANETRDGDGLVGGGGKKEAYLQTIERDFQFYLLDCIAHPIGQALPGDWCIYTCCFRSDAGENVTKEMQMCTYSKRDFRALQTGLQRIFNQCSTVVRGFRQDFQLHRQLLGIRLRLRCLCWPQPKDVHAILTPPLLPRPP